MGGGGRDGIKTLVVVIALSGCFAAAALRGDAAARRRQRRRSQRDRSSPAEAADRQRPEGPGDLDRRPVQLHRPPIRPAVRVPPRSHSLEALQLTGLIREGRGRSPLVLRPRPRSSRPPQRRRPAPLDDPGNQGLLDRAGSVAPGRPLPRRASTRPAADRAESEPGAHTRHQAGGVGRGGPPGMRQRRQPRRRPVERFALGAARSAGTRRDPSAGGRSHTADAAAA